MMTIPGIEDGRCNYSDVVELYSEALRQFPELRSKLKQALHELDCDYTQEAVDKFNELSTQLVEILYGRM